MYSKLLKKELLTWEGKISRGDFVRVYIPMAVIVLLLRIPAVLTASPILSWMLCSIIVFLSISMIFQAIKRMRDAGKSPWLLLLLLAPFVNLYVIYLLFLKK